MPKLIRRTTALLLVILALLAAGAAMFGLRPDWGYRAGAWLRRLGAENPLQAWSPAETVRYIPDGSEYTESLMLINAGHPLPSDFAPTVVEYRDTCFEMYPDLADAYAALSDAAADAVGQTLLIRDAFRSRVEQEAVYADDPTVAALPGTGEHEAGLALDLCVSGYGGMAFLKTDAGRWVGENAWRFGLIIRYPDGGKAETGIPYEPWHIRYVGAPHAEIMSTGAMTLEAYLATLEPGVFWRFGDWCISRQATGAAYTLPAGAREITIAADNTGYAVVTCRVGE